MRFRVQLEQYCGPLDLLLYLVRRHELDVLDLPIARIADQYLEILAVLEQIDVDAVGDFLDLATRLMEIKARTMLPRDDEADREEQAIDEPAQELVARLLEYKRYKDAASLLEERRREWQLRYTRRVDDLHAHATDSGAQAACNVELWDLVSAFSRVMREKVAAQPTRIRPDDTPVEVYVQRIVARLAKEPRIEFTDLFPEDCEKSRLVGLFLALLEAIRHGVARVEQADATGPIWILAPSSAGGEPAAIDGDAGAPP